MKKNDEEAKMRRFATAAHNENTRIRVMANGALAYFVKPFDGEQLLKSVRTAFDGMQKTSTRKTV